MSWFNLNVNESLSTLKGQLSNVSNVVQEVFTEGILEENSNTSTYNAKTGELDDELLLGLETANRKIDELNLQCASKDTEIQELRKRVEHLTIQSESTSRSKNVNPEAQPQPSLEDSWFWEPDKSLSSASSKENDGPSASEQTVPNLITVPLNIVSTELETPATGDERRIVEKLRRSSNEKDAKIQQLLDENSALKDQIKQSQEDANKKLEELDQQHNETIEGLIGLKEELSFDLIKLRDEQNATNLKFENLIKDHKSLSSINNDLNEHYESLKIKYKQSINENRQLSDEVNELKSELSTKLAEITELNRMFEEKQALSRDGSDEFEKIDIEKDKLSHISEVNRLQTELDEINGRLSILNDIKDQYDMNVSKLSFVIAERNELEEKVTKIQAINDELLEEVRVTREAVEKLEVLQQNLDEINSEKEQNEAALVALQEDDMVLQREFDQLKADKEKLVSELDTTKSSQFQLISSLKDKCIEFEAQLDQMKIVYSDLQIEHEKCEKRYQDLQSMHDALKCSAVDVESNLVEENMLAQKQVIDLQSALNSRNAKNEGDVESLTLKELEKIVSDTLNYISSTSNNSIKTFLDDFLRSVKETYQHLEDIEINRDNLMKQFETVSTEKMTIEHEYKTLKADLHHYEAEVAELMKNNGILLNELESVKSGKLETISEHNEDNILRLENQLEDYSKSNRKLQDEIKNTLRKLDECEEEKIELSENINDLKNQVEIQSKSIQELRYRVEVSEEEKSNLRLQLDQMRTDDSKLELKKGYEEKIRSQANQIVELNELINELKASSLEHSEQIDFLSQEKKSFLTKIENLNLKLKSQEDAMLFQLQADHELLQNELLEKKIENKSLADELNSLKQRISKSQNNESSIIDSLNESKQKIEKLEKENLELVNAIQLKHSENVQYHAKIQEQNQILIELQQTVAVQSEKLSNCSECIELNTKFEALHQKNLNLNDQITFLKEKSTLSENNLKLLEQEKIQVNEEKQVLMRDLTRLQQHLIEIENAHTAEMIDIQNNLELTRHEMSAMQEEARKSNTAYTSASIRANQHTETLQAQYAVLQQQKDDLSAKLSDAEDRESKNRAALINLQCVLEQFQKDKERDIEATTNRIRSELNEEISKRQSLFIEIQNLKSQLQESKAGLLAAARLSDQLEMAQVTNSAIKEELRKTQDKLHMTEEKFRDVESNQADRVDKNLLKNLLIGYIIAPNNDKQQILKLLSSVLDFNQQESNKVGLNKSHSSWLNSIMNPGGVASDQGQSGNYNKDSVVAAFVKFLENESQPRNDNDKAPALLNISSSSASDENKPANVQPVFLPGEVLQFNASRNSSSILKDILSDT